jgi:hypothetical protein
MPGARGAHVQRGIAIENAPPVIVERRAPLFFRQHAQKILRQSGIKPRQRVAKRVLDFLAGAEKGRAQHQGGDAGRVGLRIGQRQGRAPGAADHHPARKAEFFANLFHVRDQMRRRVGLATAFGAALAGAALVEQNRAKPLRIE